MYRLLAALLFLVAFTAASLAQDLSPSVWQSERGAILKVLNADSATGNFNGIFISSPTGQCPAVPYNLAGHVQGPRVVFETSRTWTADCSVTTIWSGRFISPTTVEARWVARSVPRMVTLQEYEAQRFSSAFKQDPIGCRSRPGAIEVRWPFAAHQTGTLAIQRATTRHGGPLTSRNCALSSPGCLEIDLGRVTDNAQLSRDLGADRLDRLES